MDFVKNLASGHGHTTHSGAQPHAATTNTHTTQPGGGGLMGKLNNMGGGGHSGEQNEDPLDKAVDFVQQRMGGGDQKNESAFEQAKDEQISDGIRRGYKGVAGKDFPIADK